MAKRLGADASDTSDPRPNARISSALGCVDAAIAAWVASGEGQRLGGMLDHAMGARTRAPTASTLTGIEARTMDRETLRSVQ